MVDWYVHIGISRNQPNVDECKVYGAPELLSYKVIKGRRLQLEKLLQVRFPIAPHLLMKIRDGYDRPAATELSQRGV